MAIFLFTILASAFSWNWDQGRFGHGSCKVEFQSKELDFSFLNQLFYQIYRTIHPPFFYGDCTGEYFHLVQGKNSSVNHFTENYGYYHNSTIWYFVSDENLSPRKLVITFGSESFNAYIIDSNLKDYFIIYGCKSVRGIRRDFIELFSINPGFDYKPYLHFAYDRGFTYRDIYYPKQDSETCIR